MDCTLFRAEERIKVHSVILALRDLELVGEMRHPCADGWRVQKYSMIKANGRIRDSVDAEPEEPEQLQGEGAVSAGSY